MVAKQAPSKAQKNTEAPQKKPPSHESTSSNRPTTKAYLKKPRNHHRRNHHRKNHLATKAQLKKNCQSTIFQPSATTKTTNDKENG
jgi:hypothetical protein